MGYRSDLKLCCTKADWRTVTEILKDDENVNVCLESTDDIQEISCGGQVCVAISWVYVKAYDSFGRGMEALKNELSRLADEDWKKHLGYQVCIIGEDLNDCEGTGHGALYEDYSPMRITRNIEVY